ncbi:MAG: hypothetical protein ACTJG1_14395 [Enterococcus gilvus]
MQQLLTLFDSLSKLGIIIFILFSFLITLGIVLVIFSFSKAMKKKVAAPLTRFRRLITALTSNRPFLIHQKRTLFTERVL